MHKSTVLLILIASTLSLSSCAEKTPVPTVPATPAENAVPVEIVTTPADMPPAETPPSDTPPAETTPTDMPPADMPPAETPPAEATPSDTPSADMPPAEMPSTPSL